MGTYNFSAEELSDTIVDSIENLEGDFELPDLKLAFKMAYFKLVPTIKEKDDIIELPTPLYNDLKHLLEEGIDDWWWIGEGNYELVNRLRLLVCLKPLSEERRKTIQECFR